MKTFGTPLLSFGMLLFLLGVASLEWYRFRFNRSWPGPYQPFYAVPIWPMIVLAAGILLMVVGYRMKKRKMRD